MKTIGFIDLDGHRLRADPARDACFRVVQRDVDMHEYEEGSDLAARETVHRHMSNEITSLDIAAQCLIEFPDAPWELRMELARQCWDESRHVMVLHRRLIEMGGQKGEFPIATFEWNITCALDSIAARLATQNRTFEAGAMDVVKSLARAFHGGGDEETSAVLDGILADEIQHVRFANRWIKRLARDDRRVLLKMAMAIRFLAEVNEKLATRDGELNAVGKRLKDARDTVPAVNIEDRKLAEFSEEEIFEILRQAGFKSLVADDQLREGTP
ncbi:MAG: hypothetical protein DMF59_09000 [Acidobacteria bacterium]|nr:MAG: hypothetical protein DMF59_09000 [Acidobacteriota bacterium]